ncbi:MAG TPA: glycosyl hydrolase family 18 protein [Dehalococcoidia bacterium]|nr:glycosyl hydrolase family 18 protein [Dehalococcoidia bacterium]
MRQRPERDPAPIIIGGTIAFIAVIIIIVFLASSVLGGGGDDGGNGGESIEVAPGVRGTLTEMPGLPPGLAAASRYIEFETENADPVTIALPLTVTVATDTNLGFYSFTNGRWSRIADSTVMPAQVFASQGCGETTEAGGSLISCSDFGSVPENLAVLQVLAQTYSVAASIPTGASLHGDARPTIVSPRDFTPVSDGSISGTVTDPARAEGVALMPTIVASNSDTAAVVNDILADENLRAQHVQQIASLVTNGDLAGIDLEYSAVEEPLRDEFTAFVIALATSLHNGGRQLSLTLPPPSSERSPYDWEQLGAQADWIRILPIADPISYWDNMPSALGTLTEEVPAHKVMLVISPFSIEAGEVARAIGYQRAMLSASELAVREPDNPEEIIRGETVRIVARNLDEGEGAAPMRWDNEAAAVTFKTGGVDSRRIFIENSYSVAFKLELVQAYGLGGVAVSDASAESDVANIWGPVNELVVTSTVALRRPNDAALATLWRAEDGGTLSANSGTSTQWVAPSNGTYNILLAVSDGDRRFGQRIPIQVNETDDPSPSPIESFAPETPEPTDTPTPEPTETTEPSTLAVQVGVLADGDDEDGSFSNDETVSPESTVTYLVTIDNDSNVPVTISSLVDDTYGAVTCTVLGGADAVGLVLAPDDGDGQSLNGGADEIQCTFTGTAPSQSGSIIVSTTAGSVTDESGGSASDSDTAQITVS